MSDEWIILDGSSDDGFIPAAGISTVGHNPSKRKGFCAAKDHTCPARRTKSSIYCVGHERAMKNADDRRERRAEAAKAAAAGVQFRPAQPSFDDFMREARTRMWGDG